jgi:hypothetical protein
MSFNSLPIFSFIDKYQDYLTPGNAIFVKPFINIKVFFNKKKIWCVQKEFAGHGFFF